MIVQEQFKKRSGARPSVCVASLAAVTFCPRHYTVESNIYLKKPAPYRWPACDATLSGRIKESDRVSSFIVAVLSLLFVAVSQLNKKSGNTSLERRNALGFSKSRMPPWKKIKLRYKSLCCAYTKLSRYRRTILALPQQNPETRSGHECIAGWGTCRVVQSIWSLTARACS